MRIAAVATIGGALAGAMFLGAALSPGMSGPEFVSAARCLAYETASRTDAARGAELRARLAFEQHAQPEASVAQAREAIRAVARRAAETQDPDAFRTERDAVCGDADARFASGAARGPG
jgi:hypothetical protein